MHRIVQTYVWTVVGLMAIPNAALAWREDPPPGRNGSTASGNNTCMQCHGTTSGSGMVEILGAPSAYAINQTYDLTVRISDPVEVGAGFQISVEDAVGTRVGMMTLTDTTNTEFNYFDPNWVNHTEAGVDNSVTDWAGLGNAAEYHLQWRAPSSDVGPITFWAVGEAIDNDHTNTGDIAYFTSETAIFDINSVPTVSQWGLTALTLAVLASGTVVVRRRAVG